MPQNIMLRALSSVSPEHIASYHRDGAVCIRQLLTPDEVDWLREGIELNLRSLSPRAKIASQDNDPGFFVEDFCTWQNNSYYQRFIFESPVGVVAGLLMQSKLSRLYHDHLLVKEPHTRQKTPWHQDQPYYNIDGRQNCSFWIPVDAVSRQSTLEFVAGSHLGPWLMPRSFMTHQAKWFPDGTLAELPDIEANRDGYNIIAWDLKPGDVVCFHMLTLHAVSGVEGDTRRRVFSLRFLGDDITHVPRLWPTSPDFPDLINQLPKGMSMEHPLFPIIWKTP